MSSVGDYSSRYAETELARQKLYEKLMADLHQTVFCTLLVLKSVFERLYNRSFRNACATAKESSLNSPTS